MLSLCDDKTHADADVLKAQGKAGHDLQFVQGVHNSIMHISLNISTCHPSGEESLAS